MKYQLITAEPIHCLKWAFILTLLHTIRVFYMKIITMEQTGIVLQSTHWPLEINGVISVIGMIFF